MDIFTIRPVTDWSISNSFYRKGTHKELFSYTGSDSQGLSEAPFSGSGSGTDEVGSRNGFTSDHVAGSTYRRLAETHYGITGVSNTYITDSTATNSGTRAFSPATAEQVVASESGPPTVAASTITITLDYSIGATYNQGRTQQFKLTAADSYQSSTRGTSASERAQGNSPGDTYDTQTPPPTFTNSSTIPATIFSSSEGATSSYYTTRPETAYESAFTVTSGDGEYGGYSTTSATLGTTATTQPSSTWGTCLTSHSNQPTTFLSMDGSHPVTYGEDLTSRYTRIEGTSTLDETSFAFTGWQFHLADTVCMMKAARGANYNDGEILWTFARGALAVGASITGRFSNMYSSSSGGTITVSAWKKYSTESVAESGITVSIGTALDGTATTIRTFSNGSFFPDQTLTSTDSTGGTAEYTNPPILIESSIHTFNLSGVASTLSTYTTATEATAPPASITLFTHASFTSTYRRSDSAWITGTTTAAWVSASQSSFEKNKVHRPVSTTHRVSYRGTTIDEILISSFSVTGAITSVATDFTGGTTGLGTSAVYLGKVKRTTTRAISLERIDTISTWLGQFNQPLLSIYGSTAGTGGSSVNSPATNTNPVPESSGAGSGGTTSSWADEHAVTQYSEWELGPRVDYSFLNANHKPLINEARFRAHPVGWCGFGGTFAVTGLVVARTTTQGLVAGATFHTGQRISLGAAVEAVRGVSFMAVASNIAIGGPARASLLSPPSGMTSRISVAATWTSATGTGSTISTSTLLATHALGMEDLINGVFWTDEQLTINSEHRGELGFLGFAGSGGYGVGQNALESSYQILIDAGYAEWTQFTGSQSTAGLSYSTSASDGTVSFSVPWSAAIVFSAEAILTARWEKGASDQHFFSSAPQLTS